MDMGPTLRKGTCCIDEPVRRPCPHGWYYGAGDAAKELLTGQRARCPRCASQVAAEAKAERREYRARRTPEQKRDSVRNAVLFVAAIGVLIGPAIVHWASHR